MLAQVLASTLRKLVFLLVAIFAVVYSMPRRARRQLLKATKKLGQIYQIGNRYYVQDPHTGYWTDLTDSEYYTDYFDD